MEMDPDDIFRDEDDDPENEFYQEREASKEMVVYLVDASPKMFGTTCLQENQEETHFHVAVSCIAQSLKTQIINRSYDEVAICFFNTREKKNLQDLKFVYVFNVAERDDLDGPTARLIKEFDCIEESFAKEIGSQHGILSGSRDNSLYNALWVAQALLRKGSAKTAIKRILLFTNEDDPFGSIKGVAKMDLTRTTLQRAKDAQDLGISIELLPLSRPDEEFNVKFFYAELLGLEGDDLTLFLPSAGERFSDMKDQLRKRMLKKRKVRRVTFSIANGISLELNTYALVRPTFPGTITWLDSITSAPLQSERSFLCADTGALVQEPAKRFQSYKKIAMDLSFHGKQVTATYKGHFCHYQKPVFFIPVVYLACLSEDVKFSVEELSEIKRVSTGHLRLLGFKPLSCLKDYHNLRPSTFLFPSDEEVIGSTCIFIALHRSMSRLKRYAVAFYGSSTHPQLVALVAQDEIITAGGQVEPPGMHMIYLPYSDDIRHIEEIHPDDNNDTPRANDDQIKKATALMRRIDLKKFSVCQFANPALQTHYAVLQALALDEDEMPQVKDETVPDEEGMARTGVVNALEEFKLSVYGENYDEGNEFETNGKVGEASRKRKAIAENAVKECTNYDWSDLADNGKLKDLTVVELKYYLTAHNLPVSGKKEALVNRILVHLGK